MLLLRNLNTGGYSRRSSRSEKSELEIFSYAMRTSNSSPLSIFSGVVTLRRIAGSPIKTVEDVSRKKREPN